MALIENRALATRCVCSSSFRADRIVSKREELGCKWIDAIMPIRASARTVLPRRLKELNAVLHNLQHTAVAPRGAVDYDLLVPAVGPPW
jgi:hypothetical protein